jgi:hypothetical protein
MRLHTDVLTGITLYSAMVGVGDDVYLGFTRHGSRKRDHAFEVSLTGHGKRHTRTKNTGTRGAIMGDGYAERAATWSDWGRFLAALYELDPDMDATYYTSSGDFDAKTHCLFAPGASVTPATLAAEVRHELATIDYATKTGTVARVAERHGLSPYIVAAAIFGE